MSKNDVIVLDSILKKQFGHLAGTPEYFEQFELFCLSQILKDYDFSVDDIEYGWVDGHDDGGIDGFYTIVDGRPLTSIDDIESIRKNPEIEVVIVTCKHGDKYTQVAINNIITSIGELFDLSIDNDTLTETYNEDLLSSRKDFVDLYVEIADKNPTLKVSYYYASRGSASSVSLNIQKRAELLVNTTQKMFSSSTASFTYLGSAEFLKLYRKKKDFSLRLKFIESSISRTNDSYIILARLDDFYQSIIDKRAKLRRYLFESNVRDYMNNSIVNNEIKNTLLNKGGHEKVDFWLLNNGVTILTSSATLAGKEVAMENVQIVNGLQTTETIFNYFNETKTKSDERALLVKIIVATNENLRDRIIKATNNQNKINLASLKATDKLQKDIEQLLLSRDWFYDRRKNYYQNQDKPSDRIITVDYMTQSLVGLRGHQIEKAGKLHHASALSNDDSYKRIFDESIDIRVYLAVVEIRKKVETIIKDLKINDGLILTDRKCGTLLAYSYLVLKLGSLDYDASKLPDIMDEDITKKELLKLQKVINRAARVFFKEYEPIKKIRRPHRNSKYIEILKKELNAELTT